jgi:hypothetical protein
MALKLIGDVSGYEADSNADKALYVESRPHALCGLGAYAAPANTGAITATLSATQDLLSFWWNHPSHLCLVRSVFVTGMVTSAITTGVQFDLALYMARGFTAPDTGGTSFSIFGPDNNKLRRDFPTSAVGDYRVANTAGLGVGTYSLDSQPLGRACAWTGTALGTRFYKQSGQYPLLDRSGYGQYPVVLAQNEGIVVQNPTAGPATGTFTIQFVIEWQEATGY